jgi:hypothetical protein
LLRDDPNVLATEACALGAGEPGERHAEDSDVSRGRKREPGEEMKERGLPGTGASGDDVQLAGFERRREVIEHRSLRAPVGKRLPKTFELGDCCGRGW